MAFYQTAPDPPLDPELRERCSKAMHVIDEQGKVYRGGEAYVYLMRAFKRPFSGFIGIQPIKALVSFAYWIVSNNRPTFAKFLYKKEVWPN